MPGFFDYINPLSKKNPLQKLSRKAVGGMGDFFSGSDEIRENVSTLRPEQEPLYQQAVNAGLNPGAGGAFGTTADYYRDLLSDNPSTLAAYSAPMMRQFNEDIIPGLSEQFAGMGAGGLSSSGFRNAGIQAGTDLAERIASIRANLRQQGASGLSNIGQIGLGNYSQNMTTQPGSPGILSSLAPAIGALGGAAIGGPAGAGIGYAAGNWFSNSYGGNKVGANSSPYGMNGPSASAQIPSWS